MSSKKILLLAVLSVIVSFTMVIAYLHISGGRKIGYVRSQVLINEFEGMKEAQRVFAEHSNLLKMNLDTLVSDYNQQVQIQTASYTSNNLNDEQRTNLIANREQLENYGRSMDARLKEEENTMLEGVLAQVNTFCTEYGKRNGYDVILGTTLSGSVLYGDEAIDITDEILKEMNANYTGIQSILKTDE